MAWSRSLTDAEARPSATMTTRAALGRTNCAQAHLGTRGGEEGAPQQGRRRPGQQDRAHRLGGLGQARRLPLDARCQQRGLKPRPGRQGSTTDDSPLTAAVRIELTLEHVGPTHGQAGNNGGLQGRCHRLAAVRADCVLARASWEAQRQRPAIRLQSAPFNQRELQRQRRQE